MTLEEFYNHMGGSYEDILRRLGDEGRIRRILSMMLQDDTVVSLDTALKKKDFEQAFRAAHTLKGVALNLELVHLQKMAAELTDILRNKQDDERIFPLLEELKECDRQMRCEIRELLEKQEKVEGE